MRNFVLENYALRSKTLNHTLFGRNKKIRINLMNNSGSLVKITMRKNTCTAQKKEF